MTSRLALPPALETDFGQFLRDQGCLVFEGRHSVYLYRKRDIEKICPQLLTLYQYPFGLKIVKSGELAPDGTAFYTSRLLAPASTHMSMRAVGSMREKVVVSNLLHEHGVAPRVFDIARLTSERADYFAFIVQDVRGRVVRGPEGQRFVRRFKSVLKTLGIDTISIKEHCDLRPPDFRDNIVADNSGTYYVDIQNFVMYASDYCATRQAGTQCRNRMSAVYKGEPAPGRAGGEEVIEPAQLLTRNGLRLTHSLVLDFSLPNELLSMNLLHQGAGWVTLVRPARRAADIRSFLYCQGFSRFAVLTNNVLAAQGAQALYRQQVDYLFCLFLDLDELRKSPHLLESGHVIVIGDGSVTESLLNAKFNELWVNAQLIDRARIFATGPDPIFFLFRLQPDA